MLYTNYQGEPIYNNQERNEATHIIAKELGYEGKYSVDVIGIMPVKEEYFDIKQQETFDGTRTYQQYKLNETGWEAFEKEFNHRGRGNVTFKMIDRKYIDNILKEKREMFESLTKEVETLENL